MQAVKPAVIATASLMILQGCAGLNELTDGELARFVVVERSQNQEFVPQRAASQGASSQDASAAPMANQQPVMAVRSTDSAIGAQAAGPAFVDPINAPPPPSVAPQPSPAAQMTTSQLASSQAASSQAASAQSMPPASRPMMLVPAPGEPMPVFEAAQVQQTAPPQAMVNAPASQSVGSSSVQPSSMQAQSPQTQFERAQPMQAAADQPQPIMAASPTRTETVVISSVDPQPTLVGREFIPASIAPDGPMSESMLPGDIALTREQKNILERFAILERLTEEGLLTRQERDQRRAQNIGALLPYSAPSPARFLGREVPSGDAISARLASLRRSLEMRAITPRQHALERSIILDALLPAEPRQRAQPEPPPSDVIEAAALIGQLESLRFSGIISDQEFDRERSAIDSYLMTGMIPDTSDDVASVTSGQAAERAPAVAASAQSGLGLHLASYRTQQAAEAGWQTISGKYKGQLSGLDPKINQVNLGQGKGTFFRLLAGPVQDQQRAKSICDQLKRSNQYCDPLNLDG
ncbi:MAG: SPOR domain-containing protein [Rhodospirillaceae bacterium]